MPFFPTVSHGSILIAQNGEKVPPFENVNVLMITLVLTLSLRSRFRSLPSYFINTISIRQWSSVQTGVCDEPCRDRGFGDRKQCWSHFPQSFSPH